MKEKGYNLLIRGSATLIKLVFILFIGKIFTEGEFGIYSLIISSVYISLILIRFDIYLDCNRKVIEKDARKEQSYVLVNQIFAYIPFYILFSILVFFIPEAIISKDYLLLFFGISILEHISSEIFRLLLAIRKTIIANLLFFIRNALWPLVIFILYNLNYQLSITTLLSFWLYASLMATIIGLIIIGKRYEFNLKYIDKNTILKSYKYASVFFIGTIAYKIVEFSDRYFIDYFLDKESVGVYSLYAQFGAVLNTIIFTVVISIGYPKLLKSIYDNNFKRIITERNTMIIEVFVISVAVIIGGIFFLESILKVIDKDLYSEFANLFYLNILVNVIFNLSYIYHFIMIGFKKDINITLITIFGAILNIIFNIILIPIFGILGAVYAKAIAFTCILVAKYMAHYKLLKTLI